MQLWWVGLDGSLVSFALQSCPGQSRMVGTFSLKQLVLTKLSTVTKIVTNELTVFWEF
jgi:hypothetical protein